MKLFFARHGQSTANVNRIIWDLDHDHPLTEEGRSQAKKLANTLKGENIKKVFCSPILRARETAEIVCTELGTPLVVRNALREIDMGELEGQSSEDAWNLLNNMYRTWWTGADINARIPGGESLVEVCRRFSGEVSYLYSNAEEANLLVVSHGGVLASALPPLMSNLPKNYSYSHLLGNTECAVVEKRNDALVCLRWQDTLFE